MASVKLPTASLEMLLTAMVSLLLSAMVSVLLTAVVTVLIGDGVDAALAHPSSASTMFVSTSHRSVI